MKSYSLQTDVHTPKCRKALLQKVWINKVKREGKIDLVQDKKIGFFEISWSTSDFVYGDSSSQQNFIEKLYLKSNSFEHSINIEYIDC